MAILYEDQQDAVNKMKNGCILCGGVGSGKSRTGLAYYFLRNGGDLNDIPNSKVKRPLYIITTARKRDTNEWEKELLPFGLTATIDSWNNILKYENVKNAFFIFDEQRVVGYKTWSITFIKIARMNQWILLTATPGDSYIEYMPVLVANGYYKNKTDFVRQHVIYSQYTSYPSIQRYINVAKIDKLLDDILIDIDYKSEAELVHETVVVGYPMDIYKKVFKERQNPDTGEPYEDAGALCYGLRKIVNSSEDRINKTVELARKHKKVIVFYSFHYELYLLREAFKDTEFDIAEWNGLRHEEIPVSNNWVYLVNYMAGAEGWNCISSDTIIFYSQSYSYKMTEQASGRINRRNTPFKKLYYYHLRTSASIDLSIARALKDKKTFNEKRFLSLFDKSR